MAVQPDVLKGIVYYILSEGNDHSRFVIPIEKVKLYISMNKKGKKVEVAGIDSTKTLVNTSQEFYI